MFLLLWRRQLQMHTFKHPGTSGIAIVAQLESLASCLVLVLIPK